MDGAVRELIAGGVAKSTLASYESGKKRYLSFCAHFNLQTLPVEEAVLCAFVAFLFSHTLSFQSVRSYLSAVCHLQVMNGLPDPSRSSFPLLDYALKGIRRGQATVRRGARLPITPELLRGIHRSWSREPPNFNRRMLWAAFCLGFFGFLRAGEFTCPSQEAFTPDMLSPEHIAVDSHRAPTHMAVHLRTSKTDPFVAGTTLHLGFTGDTLCPVTAVLGYLAIHPPSPGPLLLFEDGSTLLRPRLVQALRQALHAAGVDDSQFSGHSFRIGAATTAARAGLPDSLIKTLGRWKSSTFTLYIRTPWQELSAVSAALASPHRSSPTV